MYEMASSHATLAGMAAPASSAGIGFGLGGWVAMDVMAAGGLIGPSPGTYSWGGAAATTCVIDRAADVGCKVFGCINCGCDHGVLRII